MISSPLSFCAALTTILTLMVISPTVYAQSAKSFASMSVAEAERELAATEATQRHMDLINEALASRRMDLAELCASHPNTWREFPAALAKLQDRLFVEQVSAMMLRSNSPFWPQESAALESDFQKSMLVKPFVSAMKDVLPDLHLTEAALVSRNSRLSLADKLEPTLKGAPDHGAGANAGAPAPSDGAATKSAVSLASEPSGESSAGKKAQAEGKSGHKTEVSGESSTGIPDRWLMACVAAVGVLTVVVLVKALKGGR